MNRGGRNTVRDVIRVRFGTGTSRGTGDIKETRLDGIRSRFEANGFGLIAVTHAVIPRMREQRGGRAPDISSVAGVRCGFAAPV
jgi:NADP-dependent 3-hydroxy acid dehydrogenase YdfG